MRIIDIEHLQTVNYARATDRCGALDAFKSIARGATVVSSKVSARCIHECIAYM